MTKKTQAMRLLDGKKIEYEVFSYPATERDAVKIAALIEAEACEVYKTLVVARSKGKPMLVMVPADSQLNLKKLAKEVGEKKVKMASHAEAESLTGLEVGGISALTLLNRGVTTYLDRGVEEIERIFISAGVKGLQIRLKVSDLIRVTKARTISIAD